MPTLGLEVGLYTVFVPVVIYAVLGTSRVLSVSTTVTIAVLAAAQLGKTVPGGEPAALMATSFAMERSYFDTLDPVPSVDLFHLAIG